jgi:hypothetical protein
VVLKLGVLLQSMAATLLLLNLSVAMSMLIFSSVCALSIIVMIFLFASIKRIDKQVTAMVSEQAQG